jgi:hypothetical protein
MTKNLWLTPILAALFAVGAQAATAPCALVTQADASAALGAPALAANSGAHGTCRFWTKDHKRLVYVKTIDAHAYDVVQNAGASPVADVAPNALFFNGSVFLKKGDSYAQVGLLGVPGNPGPPASAKLVTLAKAAASRM